MADKVHTVRGTLFIDIDGTIISSESGEPLSQAVEKINKAHADGYLIILTTLRGAWFAPDSIYSTTETLRLLKSIGLIYDHIIWDCPSPRKIINDDGAAAINHPRNSGWENYNF
jgi:histidinol phosphatase-like enzyme